MHDTDFPGTYAATTTTTATVVVGPRFDIDYLKTLPGWLKIAEIILAFVTFCICVSVDSGGQQGRPGWASFVAFMGFFITLLLLIGYLLHLFDMLSKVPWPLIVFVYYGVWTLLILIAGICMAVTADKFAKYNNSCGVFQHQILVSACKEHSRAEIAKAGAGAFFSFMCAILWGFDTVLKLKFWRESARNTGATAVPTQDVGR